MLEKITTSVAKQQVKGWLSDYPAHLFHLLQDTARSQATPIYLVGGALRDWLRGAVPTDLDFTINSDSRTFLDQVREKRGTGTIVPLGDRSDNTCRLVLDDLTIDVSGFRKKAATIEEDLASRDFTINALAAEVAGLVSDRGDVAIIDPLGGVEDIRQRLIRACPGAFVDDPLRLLRAYRFAAQLDFEIEPSTVNAIADSSALIARSAVERISYECDQIMLTSRAYRAVSTMATVGLLGRIAPELSLGDGVTQPPFHHLDVLQHSLETLKCMEQVCAAPLGSFPGCPEPMLDYLEKDSNRLTLKWAALFHDIGKPVTREIKPEKNNRITFYKHDSEGAKIFNEYALRLKWSRRSRQRVSRLIEMHMHPFHLCNARRVNGRLSRRAMLKICRRAEDELPGLFLLAMADCLAGRGVERPEGIEEELAALFCSLELLYRATIRPVLQGPKLLTGTDLVDTLGLEPGPQFKTLLSGVETAQVEGIVSSHDEALEWVRNYLGKDT